MNLSELIAEVNKDVDDDLDTAYVKGWINRGIDDLSSVANYQKKEPLTLVPGQNLYSQPPDLVKVVQIVDETSAQRLYEQPLWDLNSQGYKVLGRDIIITPTPTQAKELSLYFEATLPHLENPNDEPKIRRDFHDLLVLYAVAKARYQDEEEGLQMNAMNEYLERKRQFIYECRKAPMYSIELIF